MMSSASRTRFTQTGLVVGCLILGLTGPAGASDQETTRAGAPIVDGEISGVAVDADGRALPGQRLELHRPTVDGRGELVETTHDNGRFAYSGLRPGRYEIDLVVDGRIVARSGPIELSEERMRVGDITLTRPAPPPTLPPARDRITAKALLRGRPTPTSFEALPALLERGHEVIVTDETGHTMRGRISSISPSRLLVVRKRFPFSRPEAREFAEGSVDRIQIVDSTANGAALGAAAAVGVLAGLIERDCSPSCDDNFGRTGRWFVEGVQLIPIGLALGGVVDSMINQSVYERPHQTRHFAVSPVLGRVRKGVAVQVQW